MSKIQFAEDFAKEKHKKMIQKDGMPYHEHLSAVTSRLKNLGITDEDVLSAAWLHDIIDHTNTDFDEIEQRFGSKIAVLVLSLSKDRKIPKIKQEEQYVKQLRESPMEAKIIKLCDIAAELRDLKNSTFSKTKKIKEMRKRLFYLNVIKADLSKNQIVFPKVQDLISSINDIIVTYGLRPIILVK